MRRTRTKLENQIHCERGVTTVSSNTMTVVFKYRWWWFKLNPRLVPPGLRRDHRKSIIVDGKWRGYCELRGGLIPMQRYVLKGRGLRIKLLNALRRSLGLCCRKYECGYIKVVLGKYRFIVIQSVTERGLHRCEVYDARTEASIGSFMFNQELTEVYPYPMQDGVINTLQVISGYVADSLVYSMAASSLVRTIKVVM